MTDKQVSELIAYVRILWPSMPMADLTQTIVAWAGLLSDVELVAARAVVDAYSADGNPFAPPVGLIRQRALMVSSDSDAPTAEQAWDEVCAKIRTVGYVLTQGDYCERRDCPGWTCEHRRVTFSHPAVTAAVDAMGWRTLCLSEEPMADRAHFLRFYAAAVERLTRQTVKPRSLVALEAARPVPELGPSPDAGSPLASTDVEERDDLEGLARLRDVRDALAAAQKAPVDP